MWRDPGQGWIDMAAPGLRDTITQLVAARALDVGLRTVSRWVARERATTAPAGPLEEFLASPDVPPRRRTLRERRAEREWRTAAARLEQEFPDRWSAPTAAPR